MNHVGAAAAACQKTVFVLTNDSVLADATREELAAYARVNGLWFTETSAFTTYHDSILRRFTFLVEESRLEEPPTELEKKGWTVRRVWFMNGTLFFV